MIEFILSKEAPLEGQNVTIFYSLPFQRAGVKQPSTMTSCGNECDDRIVKHLKLSVSGRLTLRAPRRCSGAWLGTKSPKKSRQSLHCDTDHRLFRCRRPLVAVPTMSSPNPHFEATIFGGPGDRRISLSCATGNRGQIWVRGRGTSQ